MLCGYKAPNKAVKNILFKYNFNFTLKFVYYALALFSNTQVLSIF